MKIERFSLFLLRVYVGYLFWTAGWQKWKSDPPFTDGEALTRFLKKCLVDNPPGTIAAALIQSYYLPHVELLSWMVVIGELAVGVALMSGTATRLACVAGILMNLNFFVASNGSFTSFDNNAFFILIQFALLCFAAGRFLGLDYFLSKKFSNEYLW